MRFSCGCVQAQYWRSFGGSVGFNQRLQHDVTHVLPGQGCCRAQTRRVYAADLQRKVVREALAWGAAGVGDVSCALRCCVSMTRQCCMLPDPFVNIKHLRSPPHRSFTLDLTTSHCTTATARQHLMWHPYWIVILLFRISQIGQPLPAPPPPLKPPPTAPRP